MKVRQKISKFVFLLLAATLVLGACSSSNGGNNGKNNQGATAAPGASNATEMPDVPSAEPVKLRITWWGSQERHDATLEALEKYTELNPNVTFEHEFSGWDGYFDKLGVQYSAKNAPDIIQMDAAYLNEYVGNNLLADLGSISTDNIDAMLLESGTINGALYAMPLGSAALGFAYDKSVIEKLGLTAPSFGWTWDDYYAFGEAVKAQIGNDKYVFVDQSWDLVDYTAYQLSQGKGQIYTEDGKVNIDKDTWIGFMTKQDELRDKGILTPPDITLTDKELDPNADSVIVGNAVARHIFSNQVGSITSLKPDAIEFASFPKGVEAGGWLKPGMFWTVNGQSAHQEEAKKFVEWFVNDEEAGQILSLTRGIPINDKVVGAIEADFSDSDKKSVEFINQVATDSQPFKIDPQGFGNFKQDYRMIVEKIMYDRLTPEQAYEELLDLIKEYEG